MRNESLVKRSDDDDDDDDDNASVSSSRDRNFFMSSVLHLRLSACSVLDDTPLPRIGNDYTLVPRRRAWPWETTENVLASAYSLVTHERMDHREDYCELVSVRASIGFTLP